MASSFDGLIICSASVVNNVAVSAALKVTASATLELDAFVELRLAV